MPSQRRRLVAFCCACRSRFTVTSRPGGPYTCPECGSSKRIKVLG